MTQSNIEKNNVYWGMDGGYFYVWGDLWGGGVSSIYSDEELTESGNLVFDEFEFLRDGGLLGDISPLG